ncbi:MAG: hypothetical protein NT169_02475 [Chloroflexi bacterium]|nr:hypothetical protein [Chloroflexota bacterium]
MKERLLTILAAVALLVTVLQPTLPAVPFRGAAPAIVPYADCQGGGLCSN